jgi:hypothetical protein
VVPPCSDRISRVPPYSRTIRLSTCTGLSPCIARLSIRFQFLTYGHWPGPRSLATTNGVSVDVLSSGYLDVSVRRVRLVTLWIQVTIPRMRWVAPFGNLRIKGYSHLPVTYRSVSRPSSPLNAKASIKCSFALVLDSQMSDTRNDQVIPGVRNQEPGIRSQDNSQTAFIHFPSFHNPNA